MDLSITVVEGLDQESFLLHIYHIIVFIKMQVNDMFKQWLATWTFLVFKWIGYVYPSLENTYPYSWLRFCSDGLKPLNTWLVQVDGWISIFSTRFNESTFWNYNGQVLDYIYIVCTKHKEYRFLMIYGQEVVFYCLCLFDFVFNLGWNHDLDLILSCSVPYVVECVFAWNHMLLVVFLGLGFV